MYELNEYPTKCELEENENNIESKNFELEENENNIESKNFELEENENIESKENEKKNLLFENKSYTIEPLLEKKTKNWIKGNYLSNILINCEKACGISFMLLSITLIFYGNIGDFLSLIGNYNIADVGQHVNAYGVVKFFNLYFL